LNYSGSPNSGQAQDFNYLPVRTTSLSNVVITFHTARGLLQHKVIYCMLISSISKVRSFPARKWLKSTVTVVSVTLVMVHTLIPPPG